MMVNMTRDRKHPRDLNEIADLPDDDDDYYNGTRDIGPGFLKILSILWQAHLKVRAQIACLGGMYCIKCNACGGKDNQACPCAEANYSPDRRYIEACGEKIFEEGRRRWQARRLKNM